MEPESLGDGDAMQHNRVASLLADTSRCTKTSEKEISHAHPNPPRWRNADDW